LAGKRVGAEEVYFDDLKVTQTKSPVVATNDYYPFGLTFNSYSRENSTSQDFKYNGKEEQTELGIGWLDYGARMYQPELGRFLQIDPLADQYYPVSPYNYTLNNPINLIDPDGRSAEVVVDEKNKTMKINIVIVFYGTGASKENVDAAIATINKMWNANAGKDGYSDAGDGWKMKVSASSIITDEEGAKEMAKENKGNSLFNYVRVEEQNNASSVVDEKTGVADHKVSYMVQNDNSGFWITGDMKTTTPSHEIGHGLNIGAWHINAEGIMVPATENRKVTSGNLSDVRNTILQHGTDKSSLVDKYLFNVKRLNYGSTNSKIYDKDGHEVN